MFTKSKKSKSKIKTSRVSYIALNDGTRISLTRTVDQNKALFESRMGMEATKALNLAQSIQKVFEDAS